MFAQDVMETVPATTAEALAVFDQAAAIEPEFLRGTWRGAELPTAHPLDGLLAASGWWGKQFVDTETVHPLLFPTGDGSSLWAMNPLLAFAGLGFLKRFPMVRTLSYKRPIAAMRLTLATSAPKARLRTIRYRGVDTAAMIYDQLPINDVLRRLSDDLVIGAMELRGSSQPYFFVLHRDETLAVSAARS